VDSLKDFQVLVVDDDRDARNIFSAVLRHFGAAVVAVTNASGAVAALRRFTPDVVLADMRLPDGTGSGVLREARALRNNAAFIAVSAFDLDEGALRDAGFKLWLRKPVEHGELVAAVRAVAREREL
jgi:two-component system OmpR family response regulator